MTHGNEQLKQMAYAAWSGILKTYMGKAWDPNGLRDMVTGALDKAEHLRESRYGFDILDTFFSDSISPEDVARVMSHGEARRPVRLLLADPLSEFGQLRADSIEQNSLVESKKGLGLVLDGIRQSGRAKVPSRAKLDGLSYTDLLAEVRRCASDANVLVHYYETPASGPMYFFRDIVVFGRFAAGISAAELPWFEVVNNMEVKKDLFDLMQEEFEYLWHRSSPSPRCEGGEPLTADGAYRVFVAHAYADAEYAVGLKALLDLADFETYLGPWSNEPGEHFPNRIRDELSRADEIVIVLNEDTYTESDWLKHEIGAAWALRKPGRPVYIGSKCPDLRVLGEFQASPINTTEDMASIIEYMKQARQEKSLVGEGKPAI